MPNGSAFSFFQEAKLNARTVPVMIGASITSLATANKGTSTGSDTDAEETTASEGEADKKDDKWVSVPSELTPTKAAATVTATS